MGGVYDMLNKPLYLSYEIVNQVKNQADINYTYKKYFELAFQFAGKDLSKWASFLMMACFWCMGIKILLLKE